MGHRPGSPRTTPPPGTDRTTQPRGFVDSVVDVAPKLFLPLPADRLPERFARCIFGLALFGLGSAMFFASELGAAPWDVFHQGIAHHTGLPVGLIIQLTGLLIVAMWYPLGLRPGWGTLLNATQIGLVVMLVGGLLPTSDSLYLRGGYLVAGLLCVGIGTGFYIGAGLGTGPCDGLMIGLRGTASASEPRERSSRRPCSWPASHSAEPQGSAPPSSPSESGPWCSTSCLASRCPGDRRRWQSPADRRYSSRPQARSA